MECTAGFFASLLCKLMLEPCRELQINYCSLSIQKYSWFIRNHLEHTKSDTICMTKKLKIVRDVSAEKNSTTLPVWVGSSQGKNARNNHACGWLRMGSAYAVLKTDFCQISPNLECQTSCSTESLSIWQQLCGDSPVYKWANQHTERYWENVILFPNEKSSETSYQ